MLFKKKMQHDNLDNDICRILNENSSFSFRESFNALCTNVLYLPIEDATKKIAITSAMPGEGKTNVAINLAISLSQNTDKKILLIDMDMRSPRINDLLVQLDKNARAGASGLSEYLAGISETAEIKSTKYDNLSILYSGRTSTSPAGLISSSKMDELFAMINGNYDYVIIDTPPINIVTDALLIANRVNGYIISTRADYSTVNSLADAENALKTLNANVFGVVLTAYNNKEKKKYQKYYGHTN